MRKTFASPSLDNLVDLACRDGVDIRPTLLRVLTDLYVQKPSHSTDEEVQYVELALGLVDTVDEATRMAVAARLAQYPAAPASVLSRLAGLALPSAITSADSNAPHHLTEEFFAAAAAERRLILTNLDAVASSAQCHIPQDTVARLERAALQHNTAEFCRLVERALRIGTRLAARVVNDASGEPIVIVAKALGMTSAVLQRILLMLNPQIGRSVARVYDLSRLFEEITRQAAEHMISIWRQADPPRPPHHEPLYWDDQHRSARGQATSTGFRIARRRDALPARNRSTEG